jgi:hypothetical protein
LGDDRRRCDGRQERLDGHLLVYAVLYKAGSSGRSWWEEWRIRFPSRCTAEMKVKDFASRQISAFIVETESLTESTRTSD